MSRWRKIESAARTRKIVASHVKTSSGSSNSCAVVPDPSLPRRPVPLSGSHSVHRAKSGRRVSCAVLLGFGGAPVGPCADSEKWNHSMRRRTVGRECAYKAGASWQGDGKEIEHASACVHLRPDPTPMPAALPPHSALAVSTATAAGAPMLSRCQVCAFQPHPHAKQSRVTFSAPRRAGSHTWPGAYMHPGHHWRGPTNVRTHLGKLHREHVRCVFTQDSCADRAYQPEDLQQ